MMYGFYNMMSGYGAGGFFELITWVALILFLILGCIYFWQKINKK